MNYFNLRLVKFFVGSTNEFFHSYGKLFLTGTSNYLFTSGTENYFFIGAENYFSSYIVNYFFGLQYIAGLRMRGGLARVFDFLGGHFEKCASAFKVFKEHACQDETLSEKESKEVFTSPYII